MDTKTLRKLGVIELNDREVIRVEFPPEIELTTRAFGVALDNDEAQDFIKREYRVYGDERGPYLVVRLPADMSWPYELNQRFLIEDDQGPITTFNPRVSVKIKPVRWVMQRETGWICWLLEIESSQ